MVVSGARPRLISPTRRALLTGATATLVAPSAARALPPPDGGWAPFDDSFDAIQMKGAINDHPVTLTLDSGAGRVVIDETLARKIGLEMLETEGKVNGLAESRPARLSGPVVINIGTGALRLSNTVIADLSSLTLAGYDGGVLIGRDIFEISSVDIDFVGKRIAIRKPGSFSTGGFRRVRLRSRQDTREIEIAVEGAPSVWGTMDLGSSSPLTMAESVARRAGLIDGRPKSIWLSSGVEGVTRYTVTTASSVRVAGGRWRDVPVDIYPLWNPRAASQVNIGYPLLRSFGRIILDYRSDSLFVATEAPPQAPFGKGRIGLAILEQEGGGYRVELVAPGSPAERGGWKEGEIIAAINGDPHMPAAVRRRLGQASRLVFTMADGSVRELVPAEYY